MSKIDEAKKVVARFNTLRSAKSELLQRISDISTSIEIFDGYGEFVCTNPFMSASEIIERKRVRPDEDGKKLFFRL